MILGFGVFVDFGWFWVFLSVFLGTFCVVLGFKRVIGVYFWALGFLGFLALFWRFVVCV